MNKNSDNENSQIKRKTCFRLNKMDILTLSKHELKAAI